MSTHNPNGETGAQSAHGFTLKPITVDVEDQVKPVPPPPSPLSKKEAIAFCQLQTLQRGEGELLYHPTMVPIEIGDVFYLRQKSAPHEDGSVDETGVVIQVISKGIASYQAADQKSLFRLMTAVRAAELKRSYHEPPETIDEFMVAQIRVRSSIQAGQWKRTTGQSVTRNVDIFEIDPDQLLEQITTRVDGLNLDVGTYKDAKVTVFGGGFEKVNLITGMKGAGKSHIAKGVIDQNRQLGVSAIVFDINENDAYGQLEGAKVLEPGKNLKFRLDRMHPEAFLDLVMRVAAPGEQTRPLAAARIPPILEQRKRAGTCPDIAFLRQQQTNITGPMNQVSNNMWASLERSFDIIDSLNLIMTETEARLEDPVLAGTTGATLPDVCSLNAALASTVEKGPSVLVIRLGALATEVQKNVVNMIVHHVKDLCQRQTEQQAKGQKQNLVVVPVYPSIFFEEAHMYMEPKDIDALIPLIRHLGPNLFFITNTPDALPDSVFRLVDNLVLTRLINSQDVRRVNACGLTDEETLSGFAGDLPEHHALLLSGLEGSTHGFPLVFKVRDFGLPPSGETRSIWKALAVKKASENGGGKST